MSQHSRLTLTTLAPQQPPAHLPAPAHPPTYTPIQPPTLSVSSQHRRITPSTPVHPMPSTTSCRGASSGEQCVGPEGWARC